MKKRIQSLSKKRLDLKPGKLEDTRVGVRKDGTKYTVRNHRKAFFFPETWLEFYDKLTNKQRVTFNYLIQTGARIMEVQHIKVGDVNYDNCFIVLRRTKVRSRLGESIPQPRWVKISPDFTKWLRKVTKEYKLKHGDTFPILSDSHSNRVLKKVLHELKVRDYYMYSVHNIRKTHETWMLALGFDLGVVAKRLGHKKETALEAYLTEDIFTLKQKDQMLLILGEIYEKRK